MSDQKLKHYELLPQQQHSWKCTLDSTYILYTRSPLPHSISQEYISLILFRQTTSRGQSLEMWRECYYLEALWSPSSDPSPDGWGRARPCCWPCKSKRTHRTEQTVSDETTTFFAALLHNTTTTTYGDVEPPLLSCGAHKQQWENQFWQGMLLFLFMLIPSPSHQSVSTVS